MDRLSDLFDPLIRLGLVGPISVALLTWLLVMGSRVLLAHTLPRPRRRRRRVAIGALAAGSVAVLWLIPTTPRPNALMLGSPPWLMRDADSVDVIGEGVLVGLLSTALIVVVCVALERRETRRTAATDRLQCEYCGYQVHANRGDADRCPECGRSVLPLPASEASRTSPLMDRR